MLAGLAKHYYWVICRMHRELSGRLKTWSAQLRTGALRWHGHGHVSDGRM